KDGGNLRTACDKIFLYCPEGYEMTQGLTSSSQCQTALACMRNFYASDARCLGLLENGVACIEAMKSADSCSSCNTMFMQLQATGCEEPKECTQ
ncbi:MAG: hypothetical protein WC889_15800, partial [Myxococcota bacterium]